MVNFEDSLKKKENRDERQKVLLMNQQIQKKNMSIEQYGIPDINMNKYLSEKNSNRNIIEKKDWRSASWPDSEWEIGEDEIIS